MYVVGSVVATGGDIVLTVPASSTSQTLTVIGGAYAASPVLNATLSDGASSVHVARLQLNATANDVTQDHVGVTCATTPLSLCLSFHVVAATTVLQGL